MSRLKREKLHHIMLIEGPSCIEILELNHKVLLSGQHLNPVIPGLEVYITIVHCHMISADARRG